MKLSQSGQMTIEAVLIMVVLLGFVMLVSKQMKERRVLAQMVSGPWSVTQGMIENGVWQPTRVSSKLHPSQDPRRQTVREQ